MNEPTASGGQSSRPGPLMAVVWLWVAAPFAYGLYELALKLKLLFTG